jgi:hypothetical protein
MKKKIKWNYDKNHKQWWTGKINDYGFTLTKINDKYELLIDLHLDFSTYQIFKHTFNYWTYAKQLCQIIIDDAR